MPITVRPLREDEAALYREIRLEGLRLHPDAFSASFAHEASQELAFFAERVKGNVIFGGFRDATLLGAVGFAVLAGSKRAHKGLLWGMYVRASGRGTGLAGRLMEAVIDHARARVELVQLTVTADNTFARRLYASHGFVEYGLEEHALKIGERYLDEVLMVKMLL
jgi:ribosomal protein S18 acetylase RimI-like enzyme